MPSILVLTIPNFLLLPVIVLAAGACGREASEAATQRSAADSTPSAAPAYVDSALALSEALRRFQASITDVPAELQGGAQSRDALVRRFVHALEARDSATINQLLLNRSEFGYLYYPTSRLHERPYALDPQMMWYRMTESSETGMGRALQRFGGRPLGYLRYDCPRPPEREGANILWSGCAIRRLRASGDTVREVLFGSILERNGRFKFVSYANRL